MFDSVKVRFVLRAVIVGLLAALAVLRSQIGDGVQGEDVIDFFASWVGVSAAYAGIGAAVPAVEPSIGVKPKKRRAPK